MHMYNIQPVCLFASANIFVSLYFAPPSPIPYVILYESWHHTDIFFYANAWLS